MKGSAAVVLASACALLCVSQAFPQGAVDVLQPGTPLSPAIRATTILQQYQLVALGEFDDLPAEAEDDPTALRPRNVLLRFHATEVFKGFVSNDILVELNSDMLSLPDGVSRYARRQKLRQAQMAEWNDVNQQLETLETQRENGVITPQSYETLVGDLGRRKEELISETLATSTRQISVVHGRTVYDLGLAIAAGEKYLIAVNPSPERADAYVLEDTGVNGVIIWGAKIPEMNKALEELAPSFQ